MGHCASSEPIKTNTIHTKKTRKNCRDFGSGPMEWTEAIGYAFTSFLNFLSNQIIFPIPWNRVFREQ
jgi:hypothetical protein